MEQKDLIAQDFNIDATIISHLKETGKWARFIGITGFVLSALLALASIFAGSYLRDLDTYGAYRRDAGISMGVITIIYLIAAVILFITALFLFKFGRNTKLAIAETSQEKLAVAFLNLKLHYRTIGIITIIYLVMVALAVVSGIIWGLATI